MEIKNWKLNEIKGRFEVIDTHSSEWLYQKLLELKIPLREDLTGLNRKETWIDWNKMPVYHRFFFDLEGWEDKIADFFARSELKNTSYLIIPYGWEEPVIKIPTELFLEDWEGFFQSVLWETVIFSEDYKLIMEVSRDYCLHSNFRIVPEALKIIRV